MKIAILIDGGYLLVRLRTVRKDIDHKDPVQVDRAIGQLVKNHLEHQNKTARADNPFSLLYRSFFYDAQPYSDRGHLPISHKAIDFAKTDEARFRVQLFQLLRRRPNFAVRLGHVRMERQWLMREQVQKDLLAGRRQVADLTDDDFAPNFRQKTVDMRLGIDIASITLKRQADTIILVTGDGDFVPAAKLARREGMRIVLDPLWREVEGQLFEHVDSVRSGYYRPGTNNEEQTGEE